ncbi:hypothetical protein [Maribacter sp. 4G9]|uniref:hypothetical protein n=1 Tax=Maribacter sp. 4G9 TaxID=1889777 RepID=UPI000C15593B|nr:hypothetical protein [Maribacter sp. 4G9]PIB27875.1 hypothetical protein BFP75_06310 [Maribacter sp. 4G9]
MGSIYLKVNQASDKFKKDLSSLSDSSSKGIYKMYYFENGHARSIKRLFSEDPRGILYIGMTEGPLLERVSNLQKALVDNWQTKEGKPASSGHTQMGKKYYRIRKKIDVDNLYIQIYPKENPKQAETDCIENYVKRFAELPPLNGQYGSHNPDWSIFD